jgi:hypothetical protein
VLEPGEERFTLYVHHFSPLTRHYCPDLPEWVYRIWDFRYGTHVHFEGNRDPDRARAALEHFRSHGNPYTDPRAEVTVARCRGENAPWRACG